MAFICAIDVPLPEVLTHDGLFDFVLCTEVMEHVANWNLAFRNLAALTRRGGRVLITCPHFYQLHEEPHDFWRPTPHALEYFGHRCGLRRIHHENAGDAWGRPWNAPGQYLHEANICRLWHRCITKLVSVAHRWLFHQLCARRLQRCTRLKGSLYLSNIAVFERSSDSRPA